MIELEVRTATRSELVDVTAKVAEAVARSGVDEGLAYIWCPHTTAGVTVNEAADPDVALDITEALERMVPRDAGYRHREGNADGHVKASLLGSSATLPVEAGRLALGTWQGVFLGEVDGPRRRRLQVRVLSG